MAILAASSLRTEQRYYDDDSRNNHREVGAGDRGHFSRASRDGRNAIKEGRDSKQAVHRHCRFEHSSAPVLTYSETWNKNRGKNQDRSAGGVEIIHRLFLSEYSLHGDYKKFDDGISQKYPENTIRTGGDAWKWFIRP